jgi:ABC-type sugar transport system substrate-binding protein
MQRKLGVSAVILLALSCTSPEKPGGAAARSAPSDSPAAVGVSFETLQTQFWVAGLDAIRAELHQRNLTALEAVSRGDAARQIEDVKAQLGRGVMGVVAVPKDAGLAVTLARLANEANTPIVFFNRPPEASDARSVAIVADNAGLSRAVGDYLCQLARAAGGTRKAAIMVGDLADTNAVERRDGFDAALAACRPVRVVARIPTGWKVETAAAGLGKVLAEHPDLGLVLTSSDFLLPAIAEALQAAGKWKKAGEPGHVILGGFDGDATAYRMLEDGYLDATGVQDVFFESKAAVQAILDLREGKSVPAIVRDEGFVIHAGNKAELAPRMWGARLLQRGGGTR